MDHRVHHADLCRGGEDQTQAVQAEPLGLEAVDPEPGDERRQDLFARVAAQEAGVAERRARLLEPSEVRTEPLPAGGGGRAVGGYNDFWLDYGTTIVGESSSNKSLVEAGRTGS